MSVQSIIKIKQNRNTSKTWRTMLTSREVERNNYHVTGDMRKAREFASMASRYKETPMIMPESRMVPVVIFSR